MQSVVNLAYLIASILFILGLKGLSRPRTALKANLLGAAGMLLAIVATLFLRGIVGYELILIGLALGSGAGVFLALKVPMTAMPQLVALFNGFGGGASVCVADAALVNELVHTSTPSIQFTAAAAASGIVGAVTFWGSLVAFAKLQGVITEKSVSLPLHQFLNALLGLLSIGLAVWLVSTPSSALAIYWLIAAASSVLGVLLVLPIGGADMPVIIALLNSYSGIAAAATGFVLSNDGLIIAGVVNPLARANTSSPIAGMPILNVDKAKTVVVIKRSLSPGFAGIPNPLFAADKHFDVVRRRQKGSP